MVLTPFSLMPHIQSVSKFHVLKIHQEYSYLSPSGCCHRVTRCCHLLPALLERPPNWSPCFHTWFPIICSPHISHNILIYKWKSDHVAHILQMLAIWLKIKQNSYRGVPGLHDLGPHLPSELISVIPSSSRPSCPSHRDHLQTLS